MHNISTVIFFSAFVDNWNNGIINIASHCNVTNDIVSHRSVLRNENVTNIIQKGVDIAIACPAHNTDGEINNQSLTKNVGLLTPK